MSAPEATPTDATPANETTAESTAATDGSTPSDSTTSTTTAATTPQNNKSMKKVKSKKDLKDPNDPTRFESPGVNFNAKLIGIDDVENARGDKMCQESMSRLKIAVKTSGAHKQKIVINVSMDGIRIIDVRTQATNHTHAVHRISFISRDVTDARAFGYVYGAGEGKHKFFAIKTEKAAEALVLALRDLFQVVYEIKKKEVEEAKHKKEEEPAEKSEEAKETQEPVYQVPTNGKPVENGTDPTYQVPGNNGPVEELVQTNDLLNLENELKTLGKGIEQIDTMEELFKELEAPPTSESTAMPAPSSDWAAELSGLSSHSMAPPQGQGMFSMGGAPMPGGGAYATGQPFQQGGFPGQQQQPFGMPVQQPGFGAAFPPQGVAQFGARPPVMGAAPFGAQPAMGAAPFGAQPNPFGAVPTVPPRTGVAMPGQPGYPGTPFPGVQAAGPGFPGQQPIVNVTPPTDPFGNDPFDMNAQFEESILTPAKMEEPEEDKPSTGGDFFGDLVAIGDKGKTNKSPKQMFTDLSAPPKKSLNAMKVEGPPSPKPPSSPVFQASGEPNGISTPASFDSEQAVTDPFGFSSDPFGNSDPFASDPFAASMDNTRNPPALNANTALPSLANDALFDGNVFGDDDLFNIPLPIGPPPPLPSGPPPPLPNDLGAMSNINCQSFPAPPPRPFINTPTNTQPIPPLPPRPKSASSDSHRSSVSSVSSISESQSVKHMQTPPLPPRPKVSNTMSVPRPRPRASLTQTGAKNTTNHKQSEDSTEQSNVPKINNISNTCKNSDQNLTNSKNMLNSKMNQSVTTTKDRDNSIFNESQNSKCSKISNDSKLLSSNSDNISLRSGSSASSVSDPFVTTDPFASDDPFTQTDPFANDPFAQDPFSDSTSTQSAVDPFTSNTASPHSARDEDPFSVFDNTFSSDSFRFDRSSSKKGKVKVTGQ